MFHAPVSESGNQNHVVFRKRKRLREEIRKVGHPLRGGSLNFRRFGLGARELGLADIKRRRSLNPFQLSEGPGREGKKVGANWPGLSKCGAAPSGRCRGGAFWRRI